MSMVVFLSAPRLSSVASVPPQHTGNREAIFSLGDHLPTVRQSDEQPRSFPILRSVPENSFCFPSCDAPCGVVLGHVYLIARVGGVCDRYMLLRAIHPSFHGPTKYPSSLRPWANLAARSHRTDFEPLDLEADGFSNQCLVQRASQPLSYLPHQILSTSPSRVSTVARMLATPLPDGSTASTQSSFNSRPSRCVETDGIIDPGLVSARFIHCQVSVTIESTQPGASNYSHCSL